MQIIQSRGHSVILPVLFVVHTLMEIACDMILECAVKLRNDAKRLQEEKEELMKHIEQVKNTVKSSNLTRAQHDDAICSVERAYQLSQTVEVSICNMVRDPNQTDARIKVNGLIERLEQGVSAKPKNATVMVLSYFNACNSNQILQGIPPDPEFERYLVGCTLDDQKEAKKRIQKLMDFLDIEL